MTSDLSTDTEGRVRKRRKHAFSSSDSDSAEKPMINRTRLLPAPPKLVHKKDIQSESLENDNAGNICCTKN